MTREKGATSIPAVDGSHERIPLVRVVGSDCCPRTHGGLGVGSERKRRAGRHSRKGEMDAEKRHRVATARSLLAKQYQLRRATGDTLVRSERMYSACT